MGTPLVKMNNIEINKDTQKQIERPKAYSKNVAKGIVESMLPAILKWQDNFSITENEIENIKSDLEKAILFNDEPYDIYAELKKVYHWGVDYNLIEILNEVWITRIKVHENLVLLWVIENNVKPKFKINDVVKFTLDGVEHSGVVIEVKEKTATYLVNSLSMGHVKKGDGVHGIHLPFEKVECNSTQFSVQ